MVVFSTVNRVSCFCCLTQLLAVRSHMKKEKVARVGGPVPVTIYGGGLNCNRNDSSLPMKLL